MNFYMKGAGSSMKEYTKAMNFYIITHLALLLIYFMSYTFLKVKEGDATEVAKQMFAGFTVVNLLIYIVSRRLNEEKKQSTQIGSEYIFYGLITCVLLSIGASYFISTITI